MPHQCTDCGTTFADGSTEMLSGCPDCGGNTFQFLPENAENGSAESDPSPAGPPESANRSPEPDVPSPDRPSPGDSVARTVGSAAATVKEFVGGDGSAGTSKAAADPLAPWPDDESEADDHSDRGPHPPGTEDEPVDRTPKDDATRMSPRPAVSGQPDSEDAAQASARSAVVGPDELPQSGTADIAVGAPSPTVNTQEGESDSDKQDEHATDDHSDAERERPDLEELRAELNDQFESIRIVEPGQYELNLMELYEREEYIIALQEDGRYRIQVPEAWRD